MPLRTVEQSVLDRIFQLPSLLEFRLFDILTYPQLIVEFLRYRLPKKINNYFIAR